MIQRELEVICNRLIQEHKLQSLHQIQQYTFRQIDFLIPSFLNNQCGNYLKEMFLLDDPAPQMPAGARNIGVGYDILTDRITGSSVLVNAECQRSPFSFYKVQHTEPAVCIVFSELKELTEYYLSNRGVHYEYEASIYRNIEYGNFAAKELTGQQHYLYATLENRVLTVSLSNADHVRESRDFKEACSKLPESYEFGNQAHQKIFDNFCTVWGTHVIIKGHLGGRIEVGGPINGDVDMEEVAEELYSKMTSFCTGSVENEMHKCLDQMKLECFWKGGDERFHKKNLAQVDCDTFRRWKTSIVKELEFLPTKMSLTSIDIAIYNAGYPMQAEAFSKAMVERLQGAKVVMRKVMEEKAEMERKYKELMIAQAQERIRMVQQAQLMQFQQTHHPDTFNMPDQFRETSSAQPAHSTHLSQLQTQPAHNQTSLDIISPKTSFLMRPTAEMEDNMNVWMQPEQPGYRGGPTGETQRPEPWEKMGQTHMKLKLNPNSVPNETGCRDFAETLQRARSQAYKGDQLRRHKEVEETNRKLQKKYQHFKNQVERERRKAEQRQEELRLEHEKKYQQSPNQRDGKAKYYQKMKEETQSLSETRSEAADVHPDPPPPNAGMVNKIVNARKWFGRKTTQLFSKIK